jgi:hypothetical protein
MFIDQNHIVQFCYLSDSNSAGSVVLCYRLSASLKICMFEPLLHAFISKLWRFPYLVVLSVLHNGQESEVLVLKC